MTVPLPQAQLLAQNIEKLLSCGIVKEVPFEGRSERFITLAQLFLRFECSAQARRGPWRIGFFNHSITVVGGMVRTMHCACAYAVSQLVHALLRARGEAPQCIT